MQSQPTPHESSGKLSTEESVELAAQVAELARAGLPLAGGLRAAADELPRLRPVRSLLGILFWPPWLIEAAFRLPGTRLARMLRRVKPSH